MLREITIKVNYCGECPFRYNRYDGDKMCSYLGEQIYPDLDNPFDPDCPMQEVKGGSDE